MVLSLLVGAGAAYFGLSFMNDKPSFELAKNGTSQDNGAKREAVNEEFEKLEKTYNYISERYVKEIGEEKLLEGAIQGMVDVLEDPYSVYMDEKTAEEFMNSLDSSFEGIGAEVTMRNGRVTIVAPFKDSPAERSGLKPNDQIITINGESTEKLDLYEAVLKIRGEKGTVVTLGIERPGASDVIKVDVTRDQIPIETVYSDLLQSDGKKIGVIEITSFSSDTAKDFQAALKDLEQQGMDGLVIDVRGNPGGYLESVDAISKLLIPKDKPFVQIEDRDGKKERYFSANEEKKPYPIVGLIDRGSASASEILAGALKEAGGYDLVGEKSFGKGTVQQTIEMGDGSNLKLTMFKWLTPDGNWIHQEGIAPTVEVQQPDYFYANPLTVEEEPLGYDMNNEQIQSAQLMLKGLGFDTGRTDGYFSKQTEEAVQAFQEKNELSVTGKIDEKTAGKLQELIIEEVRNKENDIQLQKAVELLVK
ncbi:peptidase S41 [Bacillus taeanensis]|uniref:Peptidase S41 n=2 Tax=Bacillus taeanensis TaxID=273032 RepID=A0A366Y1A1_9BACI|nr:peptidase S41 [Bacillus taeanensis]